MHFNVLVVGGDIEEQMAPFQQNNMGDCLGEYMEFEIEVSNEDVKSHAKICMEAHERYNKREIKSLKTRITVRKNKILKISGDKLNDCVGEIIKMKEDISAKVKFIKEYQEMFDNGKYTDLIKDYEGLEEDGVGNLGYLCNPNAEWDWWVIGGRWPGYFTLKKDRAGRLSSNTSNPYADFDADEALNGDIDWERMFTEREKIAKKKWKEARAKLKSGEIKKENLFWKCGIERKQTKSSYIKECTDFATYAILIGGEWQSKDSYIGKDWQKHFMEVVKSTPDTELMCVVDAHI